MFALELTREKSNALCKNDGKTLIQIRFVYNIDVCRFVLSIRYSIRKKFTIDIRRTGIYIHLCMVFTRLVRTDYFNGNTS
jgi:hypothetical protein